MVFLDSEKKLGLNKVVLNKVLFEPKGIRMNDLYPVLEDLDIMQRYMHEEMGIGVLIDVEEFVNLKFIQDVLK